jgi:hypothetical protein
VSPEKSGADRLSAITQGPSTQKKLVTDRDPRLHRDTEYTSQGLRLETHLHDRPITSARHAQGRRTLAKHIQENSPTTHPPTSDRTTRNIIRKFDRPLRRIWIRKTKSPNSRLFAHLSKNTEHFQDHLIIRHHELSVAHH